jgi:hypothetical protein
MRANRSSPVMRKHYNANGDTLNVVEPERSGDDAGGARRVSEANQPITEAPILARCGEFAGVIERGRRGIDTVSVRTDPKRLRRIVREFKVEQFEFYHGGPFLHL